MCDSKYMLKYKIQIMLFELNWC